MFYLSRTEINKYLLIRYFTEKLEVWKTIDEPRRADNKTRTTEITKRFEFKNLEHYL